MPSTRTIVDAHCDCGTVNQITEKSRLANIAKNGNYTCLDCKRKQRYSGKIKKSDRVVAKCKCGKEKEILELTRRKSVKLYGEYTCISCVNIAKSAHRIIREPDEKECRNCKRIIPISNFQEFGSKRSDGTRRRYHTCNTCDHQRKKKSGKYMLSRAFNNARRRCNAKGYAAIYKKKGIKFLLSRQEIYDTFLEAAQRICDEGGTPTIHRLDHNGHYEVGNIEVIPWLVHQHEPNERRKRVAIKKIENMDENMKELIEGVNSSLRNHGVDLLVEIVSSRDSDDGLYPIYKLSLDRSGCYTWVDIWWEGEYIQLSGDQDEMVTMEWEDMKLPTIAHPDAVAAFLSYI